MAAQNKGARIAPKRGALCPKILHGHLNFFSRPVFRVTLDALSETVDTHSLLQTYLKT